jgi:hypothetical protein
MLEPNFEEADGLGISSQKNFLVRITYLHLSSLHDFKRMVQFEFGNDTYI